MSLPGLPALPPALQRAIDGLNAATAALVVLDQFFPGPQPVWGIFDQAGNNVLVADTVVSFDFRNDWKISDYPQEDGAFGSYNKVATPFDIRIRFSVGGSADDRAQFLTDAQAVADSIDLYSVVTPEATYLNCNVAHIDYHREQHDAANRIVLDVWLNEIRQGSSETGMSVGNVKIPSSSDPESAGQVQAVNPSDNDVSAIT